MTRSQDAPLYRAHTFEDLLNAVPTLFGFVPRESIIGLCVSGPRNRFGFRLRVDIPRRRFEDEQVAALVAEHLQRNADDGVILIGLSEHPAVAEELLHAVGDRLGPVPVRLKIWANAERLWTDLRDCPSEGEPYQLSAVHEARVTAVAAGLNVLEDREALYDEIAPVRGPRQEWMHDAAFTVLEDVCHRRDHVAEIAQVERLLDGGPEVTDGDAVRLGVLVTAIPPRDAAWLRIDRANAPQMHRLWCTVASRVPESMSVPALCLAGFSAWLWGDGARALVALERAREIAPDYSMANLLFTIVSEGVNPARWADIDPSGERLSPHVLTRRSA
ncbi:DUF4192 domain-containing protein [Aeromicrobium phragmitis]|uniref:DUF4192 domain-containing protein n=1 Tax=Aeromicrobium phragmitis TaxID=2478914 RepID=A0A3L8PMH4_9ACTN|nr:DUF4192 domain-containing protein [Aeromicrobium phragmitis]RLV55232.1 DUF4192 domain-containing protein [Aeromicrobium phragmitis]